MATKKKVRAPSGPTESQRPLLDRRIAALRQKVTNLRDQGYDAETELMSLAAQYPDVKPDHMVVIGEQGQSMKLGHLRSRYHQKAEKAYAAADRLDEELERLEAERGDAPGEEAEALESAE